MRAQDGTTATSRRAGPAAHGKGDASFGLESDRLSFDVLDAWFPPCPRAVEAGASAVEWTLRSSPSCDGAVLLSAVAASRGIDLDGLSLGAGSSEIIHRILPRLFGPGPVVVTDPTYSEYAFVAEDLHGRRVRRFELDPDDGFLIDVKRLVEFSAGASVVIVVNPNNPTGGCLSRSDVLRLRDALPTRTALWIDEAYVDYAAPGCSVEVDAVVTTGLYVLKSLSKAYGLSGARVAYLVCAPLEASEFRRGTPPWIVGHAATLAAIEALRNGPYYQGRYAETAAMRSALAEKIRGLGFEVWDGALNAVLIRLPDGYRSPEVTTNLARMGVFVRDPVGMGRVLSDRYIRVSVKPEDQQVRLLAALCSVLELGTPAHISGLNRP